MASTVAIYGDGQLGRSVATLLSRRPGVDLIGPFDRAHRESAIASGADVVVIATTTRLADVAPDVIAAVESGSNVLVSAEESAFPWAIDDEIATRIDALARDRGVTVLGGGVNPGFIFDALLITLLGPFSDVQSIEVTRNVDISGFGDAVLGRLGVGFPERDFTSGVEGGTILGHAGFPQSMGIVAYALGIRIERIERNIEPILAEERVTIRGRTIEVGSSVGVRQLYVAFVDGRPWFSAAFVGHLDLRGAAIIQQDELRVHGSGGETVCLLKPGIDAQRGSAAMVSNSIDRVIQAAPGWVTVADLPPAHPAVGNSTNIERS